MTDHKKVNCIMDAGGRPVNYDECVRAAKSGRVCQMLTPDGKWVKFDPSMVISQFRVVPELQFSDGRRVMRYVLYEVARVLGADYYHIGHVDPDKGSSSAYEDAENKRFTEKLWKGITINIGKERSDTTSRCGTNALLAMGSHAYLRYLFKTYFRIVNSPYTDTNGNIHHHYSLNRRSMDGIDRWVSVFGLNWINDDGAYYWEVQIEDELYGKYVKDTTYTGMGERWYTDTTGYVQSTGDDGPVKRELVKSVSPGDESGRSVTRNIAIHLSMYFRLVSTLDRNIDNFRDFFDVQVAMRSEPTYRIEKIDDNRSYLCINEDMSETLKSYLRALVGYRNFGRFVDIQLYNEFIRRYITDKYGTTIDFINHSGEEPKVIPEYIPSHFGSARCERR